jgi:molybdopterin-guanine dinucleotide biosynthesis protein A
MEIGTCKKCVFYTKSESQMKRGFCSCPVVCDDTGDCYEAPINGIYATCDECRGELWVGEDFGCIHFEAK